MFIDTQTEYEKARKQLRHVIRELNATEELLSYREHLGFDTTEQIQEIRSLNAQHDRLVYAMSEFEIETIYPCNF
jgi:uncharacterized coiled-coil protein SlyX